MNIKMLQMMELIAKINLYLKNGIMQKETTFYKDDTNMGISFFESSEKKMIRLNLEGLGGCSDIYRKMGFKGCF